MTPHIVRLNVAAPRVVRNERGARLLNVEIGRMLATFWSDRKGRSHRFDVQKSDGCDTLCALMAEVLSLKRDREAALDRAASAVSSGLLAVFPTDTIYGVGADAFQPFATAALFAAKGRPRSLPLPVMVNAPRQAWALCAHVPDEAAALAAAFWPGGLTLVLHHADGLLWDLGDGRGTVALRIPANADSRDLIARVGPMAVTSANRTGDPTPRTAKEIAAALGDAVAVYLDGGRSRGDVPSTIVDFTGRRPRLRREGVVPKSEIERVIGGAVAGS